MNIFGQIIGFSILGIFFYILQKENVDNLLLFLLYYIFFGTFFIFRYEFLLAPQLDKIIYFLIATLVFYKYPKSTIIYTLYAVFPFWLYILISDYIMGIGISNHMFMYKHGFWGFYTFLYLYKERYKIKLDLFLKHLKIIIVVQFVLSIAQYLFYPVSKYFTILTYNNYLKGTVTINFGEHFARESNIICGSLTKPTNFSEIMSIIYLFFVLSNFYFKNNKKFKSDIFYMFMSIVCLLLAGTRSPMFLVIIYSIVILFYLLWDRKKYIHIFIIGILIVSTSSSLIYFVNKFDEPTGGWKNPVLRIASGFSVFTFSEKAISNSTLKRSMAIIDDVIEKPIFGKRQYSKQGYYVGIDSPTDAYFLFNIAESGLVGLFLLILPYLFVLKRFCKNIFYPIFFLFWFSFSHFLVDQGLLDTDISELYYILVIMVIVLEYRVSTVKV